MTASEYRYLLTIRRLRKEAGRVTITDVARKLSFARASVYKKLLALEQRGYVAKDDDKSVSVTAKGDCEFETVRRLVEICEDMLAQNTGLDKRLLAYDAVAMACALSSGCRNALIRNN